MESMVDRLEKWLPRRKIDIFGKNSLIHTSLPYYILSLIMFVGFIITDDFDKDKFKPFLYVSLTYSVFPILDQISSLDQRNPTSEEVKQLQKNDAYFRLPMYAAMILSYALNYLCFINFATLETTWNNLFHIIGIIFLFSNIYSVQFIIIHELMHKPGRYYRKFAIIHSIMFYYTHFIHDHLYIHHPKVATPDDPTSPKKGENIYHFLYNCIVNNWKGVYQMEKNSGKKIYANAAILSLMATFIVAFAIYTFFGLQPMIVHSLMVIGAICYLQTNGYIEHYGLTRKKLPNGEYEKVTIHHSWNAPHRFSNYLLFKLQRHSDHHENSSKPYQTLDSLEESPFLPHGNNLMIIMAFFPKVWFRVMDPLLEAYQKLNIEKKERIDPKIKEFAKTETRKFLIQLALSAFLLAMLTVFRFL